MSNNLGTASGKIEINTGSLREADIALRSAGRGAIGFGVAAVAAFGYVVAQAAKFEKEMDFVQAVTNASAQEMEGLNKAALDLAKNSVYGPVQLSKAFVELAKAGASVQQIIDGVGEAAVNLATAADIEIPFAGESLINILNTFKLGAEDAVRVSDLLAGAANASSVEFTDLVTSLKYAGPVAQGLGIDIEDVNDALTILGKVGIKGSTAGTSLRQIMLNLSPPTEAAADQMRELGILTEDGSNLFFDQAGNAKSLAEVFEILRDKMKGLNNEQQTEALRDLFGVRAIPAALELLSQGAEGFKEINDEINRTTAADVAAKRMDNLDGSIKRLKATMEAMFVEAGGPFQQMLKNIVDGFREFLLWIDALPGPLKTAIVAAVGIIGVLSILSGIFLLTIGNIVRAIRVFGQLHKAFQVIGSVTKVAAGGVRLLSSAFLASPIFWVIAAIIALIAVFYLLYTRVEGFRKFIDGLWQDIQAAWDGITKGFYDLYKSITNWLGDLIDWLSKLPENAKKVADEVFGFVQRLPGEIASAIGSAAAAVGRFFARIAGAAAEFAVNLAKSVGSGILSGLSAVVGFFADLPGLIGEAFMALSRFLSEFLPKLAKAFGFLVGRIIRIFLYEIPKAILKGLWWIVKNFVKYMSKLPGIAYRFLKMVISNIIKFGIEAVKLVFRIGFEIVKAVLNFLISLPGRIWDILMSILNFLVSFLPIATSAAWNIGSGVFEAIWGFFTKLPGLVWDAFTGILSFLWSLVTGFFSAAWDIGKAVFDGIIGFLMDLPGNVAGWLWDALKALGGFVSRFWDKAYEIGKNLWEGFKKGLFGSPHTKIEYAMWDMEANMKKSLQSLKSNMRTLHGMENRMPQLNAGLLGLPTPAAAALTANGGGTTWQQNAPLLGSATIRSDKDIVDLARELEKRRSEELKARGRRMVKR